MKKLCILFLVLFSSISFSQIWTAQGSETNSFYGVSFTDANNGTAVGASGTIRRTVDGGTNWTTQTSPVTNLWYAVSFTDASNGTAVGTDGTIIRTTNGGADWIQQNSGTTGHLYAISFTDANNGTAVGVSRTIRRTIDGGANWISQNSGPSTNLHGVSFIDASSGIIVGSGGTILTTTNGGTNWTQQTSGTTSNLYAVSFTDADNATAVGQGGIVVRTTNGGINWVPQSSGTVNDLRGVSFTDANNGTAVGLSGTIIRTTNGGTNWTTQTSGTPNDLKSVSFINTDIGTAVGISGVILRTENGALPVEMTSFTITMDGANNFVLRWDTATEVNNYGFEIERNEPRNTKWKKIGFVQGHGNSNSPQEYSFTDKAFGATEFKYRLKQIDFDGEFEYSPEVEVKLEIPADFFVKQNFPNPFNPTTRIEFVIPTDNLVQIKVYNVLGMEVATLLNEYRQAGTHSIEFNACNLSSGIYFYKAVSGNISEIKKMILLR